MDMSVDSKGETAALLADRLRTAQRLGADSSLVLHGGGNVSVKSVAPNVLGDPVDVLHIKASGADLGAIQKRDLIALELAPLRRLRSLRALPDEAMVNEFRRCLLDASAPNPSIETLVHAFLPHRFVDHSHADAVVALTNRCNGADLIRDAVARDVAVLAYIRPGFDLAREVVALYESDPAIHGIVLLQHGLLTFADDAEASFARHLAIVAACQRAIERRVGSRVSFSMHASETAPNARALVVAPILRGLLSRPTQDADRPHQPCVLEWRGGDELLTALQRSDVKERATSGPLTGDHVVRTKPWPVLVDAADAEDDAALRSELELAINGFRREYREYRERRECTHEQQTPNETAPVRTGPDEGRGGPVGRTEAHGEDDLPVVMLAPGIGLFARGETLRDARIAADIAERTLLIKDRTAALGPFVGLEHEHLFDNEFRFMQRAKRKASEDRPLAGHVVVISGGAGAIGADIADECAAAGAHVALADVDDARLAGTLERLRARHAFDAFLAVNVDVTDERSVVAGYHRVIREFGGVDVIVPNAGIAHVRAITDLTADDLRRTYEVNTLGCLLFLREGAKILRTQGIGGNVVIVSSKNVFGPGKDFGAYSASKAAAHQLGKVAAIELAEFNIRVNMINADAIFGDSDNPSGLWATVGPERAKSRNLDPARLEEYYRGRSLLKTRVLGRHVGRAVVFFATNQTPTTGATLPVDAGVVEAFPR